MVVTHTPAYGPTPRDDEVIVVPCASPPPHPWSPFAGPETGYRLSPLSLLGNPRAVNPVSYNQSIGGVTTTSTQTGANEAEVRILISGGATTLRLLFWLQPEIPVITRLSFEGNHHGEIILDDFVRVRGGVVARTVRAFGERGPDRHRLRVWRSEDLGKRDPSAEDFVIRVPEQCRVRCLVPESIPQAVNGIRAFDVTQFTLDDILIDCYVPQHAPRRASTRWPLRVLGLIGMLLVAGWFAFGLYRRRSRHA